MAPTNKQINVIVNYITKNSQKFIKNSKRVNDIADERSRRFAAMGVEANNASKTDRKSLQESLRNSKLNSRLANIDANNSKMRRIAQMGFSGATGLSIEDFKEFNKSGRRFQTVSGAIGNRFRQLTHGVRGFRMEMLGVMFFGMAMNRMFTRLLRTSLEWTGAFKLLQIALGILFLPTALKILGWVIKFLGWVTSLTTAQKEWWGNLVLIGIVIGTLLRVLGTLALGFGSIILVLGNLTGPLIIIGGLLAAFFILPKIVGWLTSFNSKLEDSNDELTKMGFSADIMENLGTGIGTMIQAIEDKLPELGALGGKIGNALFEGMKTWIKDNPLILLGAISGAWLGGPLGAAIGAVIGKVFQEISFENIEGIVDGAIAILDSILQGLLDNMDVIEEFIKVLLEKLAIWIVDNTPELIELGLKIGNAIVEGIENALSVGTERAISNAIGPGKISSSIGSSLDSPLTGGMLGLTKSLYDKPATSTAPNQSISSKIFGAVGGMAGLVSNLGFKQGGVVPGRLGTPVPILAHAGERVIPANRVNNGGSGAIGNNITNNFFGFTMNDLTRELDSRDNLLMAQIRRNE